MLLDRFCQFRSNTHSILLFLLPLHRTGRLSTANLRCYIIFHGSGERFFSVQVSSYSVSFKDRVSRWVGASEYINYRLCAYYRQLPFNSQGSRRMFFMREILWTYYSLGIKIIQCLLARSRAWVISWCSSGVRIASYLKAHPSSVR